MSDDFGHYLGLDLGTSCVKAVILSGDGKLVAEANSSPLSISRRRPGWSEQSPEHWWGATVEAITALPAALRSDVAAVGLAGQMHGAVCLDDRDRVIYPAILWNDGRSQYACDVLEDRVPDLRPRSANKAMAGFTAPKLIWLADHEPEVFSQIRTVLLPKDWLRLRLSGDKASDMSDSAGTLWVDVPGRKWNPEAIDACGLDLSVMPRLVEGTEITGRLRRNVADQLGLPMALIVAGAGDNAAGAIGLGAVEDGTGFLSLGTSGVIFVADDEPRAAPDQTVHTFCHAVPGMWHRMGVVLSAATAIDWAAERFGFASSQNLISAVDSSRLGTGPIFLPYLSGERTPHDNPALQAHLIGLSANHTRSDIAAAVLEGVSHTLADATMSVASAGPIPDQLSVIGGGARSDLWCSVLASMLDHRLVRRQAASSGPAVGAARLAQIGTGNVVISTVATAPAVDEVFDPNVELTERFRSRRDHFRSLAHMASKLSPKSALDSVLPA